METVDDAEYFDPLSTIGVSVSDFREIILVVAEFYGPR